LWMSILRGLKNGSLRTYDLVSAGWKKSSDGEEKKRRK
jgi:hypothetical protein